MANIYQPYVLQQFISVAEDTSPWNKIRKTFILTPRWISSLIHSGLTKNESDCATTTSWSSRETWDSDPSIALEAGAQFASSQSSVSHVASLKQSLVGMRRNELPHSTENLCPENLWSIYATYQSRYSKWSVRSQGHHIRTVHALQLGESVCLVAGIKDMSFMPCESSETSFTWNGRILMRIRMAWSLNCVRSYLKTTSSTNGLEIESRRLKSINGWGNRCVVRTTQKEKDSKRMRRAVLGWDL